MSKYVVSRKDVCAGQLLKTGDISFKIVDANNNEVSKEELAKQGIAEISFFGGLVCRGMLFNVNEDGLANDLIYTTPTNYPIMGVTPEIEKEAKFVIDHYVELEELLKYLNYGVDLTQADLNQIHKRLIAHDKWLKQHMELFGWKKCSVGHVSGGVQTIPMSVYDNLSSISCLESGKPCKVEPGCSYIKKRKAFF